MIPKPLWFKGSFGFVRQVARCGIRGNSQAVTSFAGMKLDTASKLYAMVSSASSQPTEAFSLKSRWSMPAAINNKITPTHPERPHQVVNAILGIAPGRCKQALVAQIATGRPIAAAQIRPGTRSSQSSHPYGPFGSNSISRKRQPMTPTAAPKNMALRYPWSCLAT